MKEWREKQCWRNNTLNDKAMMELSKKSVLQEVNKELEELEALILKGAKELEGLYLEKREAFSMLVKKAHDYITELERNSEEKLQHLKKNSQYLVDTLDKDFDFSYTEYDDARHDLKSALHDFEASLEGYYKALGDEAMAARQKFEAEMRRGIDHIKADLTLQKSYLDHIKDTSVSEWEEWMLSKQADLNTLKGKIDAAISDSKQKVGKFNEEIHEAYDHLMLAFDELKE